MEHGMKRVDISQLHVPDWMRQAQIESQKKQGWSVVIESAAFAAIIATAYLLFVIGAAWMEVPM